MLPSPADPVQETVRILLVDDHSLFRESLSRLLESEPGFQVVGSCATASDAYTVLERERPDVVLLDYDLGSERGTAFAERAKLAGFKGGILVVTAGMTEAETLLVFESGLSGLFLKHSSPTQLIEAIHRVKQGEQWIDSRAVRSLIHGAHRKAEESEAGNLLTERERAVLKALFAGMTNKEAASALAIPETAVKWTIQRLFGKLGVRTRSQLVRIALERGAQDW
jgi:two-component system nitrate/nitrite response regulator NarL